MALIRLFEVDCIFLHSDILLADAHFIVWLLPHLTLTHTRAGAGQAPGETRLM